MLAFLALLVTLVFVGGSVADAASPIYGPGIGADSLANTIIGGPNGTLVSYRFRATESAALDSITIYLQTGSGYSAGDRGTLRIAVRQDSGAPDFHPAGPILAQRVVKEPNVGAGKTYRFRSPPRLQAGSLYHVVFSNTHPQAASNYISINGLYIARSPTAAQPKLSTRGWAHLTKHQGGDWMVGVPGGALTPIMALRYANGASSGMGYVEVWLHSKQIISGESRVREVFSVWGRDKLVSSLSLRVKREAGQGPLHYRLRRGDGKLIEKGAITADRIPMRSGGGTKGFVWATIDLRREQRLRHGKKYQIVFRTKNLATTYSVLAIREGASYGYPTRTFFANGRAEFWDGSRWRLFHAWGEGNPEGDLQFYFR